MIYKEISLSLVLISFRNIRSRAEYDEVDYPTIFAKSIKITTQTLENNINCIEMYKFKLPTSL